MKIAFREKLHLSKKNEELLIVINKIINDYSLQGYKLTLRQLYYQLVSRDIIPNKQSEYAKLSGLLVKGRMGGVVDWNAIEDRLRKPYLPYWARNIKDAINDIIGGYRLDRQEGQEVYIELWVEKDALSGVLKKITSKYHINLMVNRGYSSCSAMYNAYERFAEQIKNKKIVILYLGDHDPSGLDMIRDIKERILEFLKNDNELGSFFDDEISGGRDDYFDGGDATHFENWVEERFKVKHIGITKKQIEKYNPPPNPAKITDPRAKWYIKEFGNVSWEVDALNPKVLHELVKKHVEKLIDMDLFHLQLMKEEKDKKKLKEMTKGDE